MQVIKINFFALVVTFQKHYHVQDYATIMYIFLNTWQVKLMILTYKYIYATTEEDKFRQFCAVILYCLNGVSKCLSPVNNNMCHIFYGKDYEY